MVDAHLNKGTESQAPAGLRQVLKHAILASLLLVIGLGTMIQILTSETNVEAPKGVVYAEVEQQPISAPETPLEAEIVETPPEPVNWRTNPNNCDTDKQYIREDNLQCLDKPLPAQSARRSSTAPTTQQSSVTASTTYSGNKQTWLAASGIPEAHWWAVDSIVSGESGWNPNAVNRSSGACGLGQQLPCGKWGGDWRDPVKALKDIERYVMGRYGSWSAAVTFRNCTGQCWQPVFKKTVYKDHTWY